MISVEDVRGHSSLHTGASPTINQVTYGEVLLVKIVPAAVAVDAKPLIVSDGSWKSSLVETREWWGAGFDDSGWTRVQELGVAGAKSDFLQWNADAGLYAWPGYVGIGAAMRTFHQPVAAMRDIAGGERLRGTPERGMVVLAGSTPAAVTLDFGKEMSGRLHLTSDGDTTVTVETSYGESAEEALGHPYLGVRKIVVPAHGDVYGPKSGFRYVRLMFGAEAAGLKVDAQGITYPIEYQGVFESSDGMLNRIWETAAYTAHLCMQEGIWDGVKRDRGRWMGDLDVTGRTISSVFGERRLMEETMTQVVGDEPVKRDVNTIAGYSALWITGEADFYRHVGDLEYLKSMKGRLLELLEVMDAELDDSGLFTNPGKHKVFVDWSTGFSSDAPEARAATHLEFYLAYREAAYLLGELGDRVNAEAYGVKAERMRVAAQSALVDKGTQTFGARWQTNAMAVVSGAATEDERKAIWTKVLAHVGEPGAVVTPYYGYYVLAAMAGLDHRAEALGWMREYWGGMLAEGATSFWEAYDPRWPKEDFHAYLEADGKKGYYASLAHGWASGPAAWLMEQVLGIQPTGKGFATVMVRPDLAGLGWAKGAEPTPRGLIKVDATTETIKVTLPKETVAMVSLPFAAVMEDGKPVESVAAEDGRRSVVTVKTAGEHVFTRGKAKL